MENKVENNVKNKIDMFLKLSIICNVILIFFGSYIGNLYILQIIPLALVIIPYNVGKLKVGKDTVIWIMASLISVLSIIYSVNRQATIQTSSLIIMAVLLKCAYENKNENWTRYFINATLFASAIHVIATILQLMLPNVILMINSYILPANGFQVNQELYKAGGYAGITSQTGVNACYISIFLGIIFLKLMFEKSGKKINTIWLILGIIALFLTGKRGMLVFTVISIIMIFIYTSYIDKKNIFKYLIIILLIGIIGYAIIINIPEARNVFEKMQKLEESGDMLNGRDYLWGRTINIFKNNFLAGIGIGAIPSAIGEYAHNIYIELLAEVGVVGFLLYICAILTSFFITLKKVNLILKKGNVQQKVCILFSIFMQSIFIMYGFTGNPLYDQSTLIPYMVSIAIGNTISIKEEKRNESRDYYLP